MHELRNRHDSELPTRWRLGPHVVLLFTLLAAVSAQKVDVVENVDVEPGEICSKCGLVYYFTGKPNMQVLWPSTPYVLNINRHLQSMPLSAARMNPTHIALVPYKQGMDTHCPPTLWISLYMCWIIYLGIMLRWWQRVLWILLHVWLTALEQCSEHLSWHYVEVMVSSFGMEPRWQCTHRATYTVEIRSPCGSLIGLACYSCWVIRPS